MNYFFLAAAFFAFHLLLAYLVDHVNVHLAFAISAVTSVFLVVSYLRLVGGMRFALLQAGLAQMRVPGPLQLRVLLRGLHRASPSPWARSLTLFVLMQLTGRVDWSELLARRASERPRP